MRSHSAAVGSESLRAARYTEPAMEPLQSKYRTIVVGGGIAGAATAWALAERGEHDVIVLERERQLGAHSTSKNASILRTLTEGRATTAFALETADFFHSPPPGFSDVPLVDPVGLIMVPTALDRELFEWWRARKAPGSVEEISAAQLEALAPHYGGRREGAIIVRDEGHIDVSAVVDGLVRSARERGVRFETAAEVRTLVKSGACVSGVELADGRCIAAERVVLAAGGWAARLGAAIGAPLHLEARRRHLLVTAADEDIDPRWPIVWSEHDAFYVRPESGGLMLCACDQDVVDADHCEALEEVLTLIAERSAKCLIGFEDARAAHFWAGMRTFAEDPHFVIGPDSRVGGLFWVAALGGHGISTCIGFGRFAAALLGGEPVDPESLETFSPSRTTETEPGSLSRTCGTTEYGA